MTGITATLRALHQGERDLEHALLAAADRHRGDHEFHHLATDVARWSHEHAARLAHIAPHYDLELPEPPEDASPSALSALREKAAEAFGLRPEPGLLLLHDLRHLHMAAVSNSLYWEMLAQAAQATRDRLLLGLTTSCHPQTLRQMRWTNTMIKELSPQLLTST